MTNPITDPGFESGGVGSDWSSMAESDGTYGTAEASFSSSGQRTGSYCAKILCSDGDNSSGYGNAALVNSGGGYLDLRGMTNIKFYVNLTIVDGSYSSARFAVELDYVIDEETTGTKVIWEKTTTYSSGGYELVDVDITDIDDAYLEYCELYILADVS